MVRVFQNYNMSDKNYAFSTDLPLNIPVFLGTPFATPSPISVQWIFPIPFLFADDISLHRFPSKINSFCIYYFNCLKLLPLNQFLNFIDKRLIYNNIHIHHILSTLAPLVRELVTLLMIILLNTHKRNNFRFLKA